MTTQVTITRIAAQECNSYDPTKKKFSDSEVHTIGINTTNGIKMPTTAASTPAASTEAATSPIVAISNTIPSVSINIRPFDHRCLYWAKVVRAGDKLPIPSDVQRAVDIDGPFLRLGDEELFPGDLLFEGEANHHNRTDRGWSYWVSFISEDGDLVRYRSGFSAQKAAAKAQGLPSHLLAGSGDVAGAVRVAHALRLGLNLPSPDATVSATAVQVAQA